MWQAKSLSNSTWKGKIPKKVVWRGTGDDKKIVPEGRYIYEIDTIDHAQNQKSYQSKPFRLVKKVEELSIAVSDGIISQMPSAKIKTITVAPDISSQQGLEKIDYHLNNENDNSEKYLFSKSDVGSFTLNLEKEKILPSDNYDLVSKAFFNSGNEPVGSKKIFIDNLEPMARNLTEPDLFSPDDDGRNEVLNIKFLARDNYGLKRIDGWIFRKVQFLNRKPFKQNLANYLEKQLPLESWSWEENLGKDFSEIKKWNGEGRNGQKVESATEYIVFTKVEDEVGLSSISQNSFLVDILVERLPDGRLKIILNNINFKFDSDLMIGGLSKDFSPAHKDAESLPDLQNRHCWPH